MRISIDIDEGEISALVYGTHDLATSEGRLNLKLLQAVRVNLEWLQSAAQLALEAGERNRGLKIVFSFSEMSVKVMLPGEEPKICYSTQGLQNILIENNLYQG